MEVPEPHPFFAISSRSHNADWLRSFRKAYGLTAEKGASAKVHYGVPKAILLVSAHWETSGKVVRVSGKSFHDRLLYDYYGFPKHTYDLKYQPKGDPALAKRVVDLLSAGGIKSEIDPNWCLDHGAFIPLKMTFPDADVPVVEVSIDRSYDPAWHLKVGEALAPLRQEGVLIIGSGSSTHNFNPDEKSNETFMKALASVLTDGKICYEDRVKQSVLEWAKLPHARDAHPQEDHLVPLFVAVGAAGGGAGAGSTSSSSTGQVVGKVQPAGSWQLASFMFQ